MSLEKLLMGDIEQDREFCVRCGSKNLDTGWECNDCGYDNMHHYYVEKPNGGTQP